MPSTADYTDVQSRWRTLTADEQSTADTLLDDAWRLIVQRLPNLDQQITDGDVDQDTVTMVQARMVLRVLKNPEGYRQASIDDWSFTRDAALSAGELYVSDGEIAIIDGPAATEDAFTIRPYGEPGFTASIDMWTA